ncbi:MAG TPA: type II secretion system protein GspM [Polyangiales bacterium]|jgi:type II secretory pathway component PulM|nr:type II secretion system protein GspM [Polyangiales bacterium]
MNNPLFERLRATWENLNDRERRMLSILGAVFGAFLLIMPPILLVMDNADLEAQNTELRNVVEELDLQRNRLARLSQERSAADQKYLNKTPPLGSFMESEAKKQGLTLQEVTDQPEKTVGRYLRRSVTVALPQVALTPLINLLSSIVESGHPVAVDQLQIDHFQAGDQYNVKLGILTFDKLQVAAAKTEETGG